MAGGRPDFTAWRSGAVEASATLLSFFVEVAQLEAVTRPWGGRRSPAELASERLRQGCAATADGSTRPLSPCPSIQGVLALR